MSLRESAISLSLLFLLAAPASAASDAPKSAMHWEAAPFEAALGKAKAQNRWLLVDIYATWCGPCHELDEKVWSKPEVAKALEPSFIVLRKDGESDGADLAKRYHVVGYPTLLVLDEKGVEVDRIMGSLEPKELVDTLARFRAGKGTLAELEKQLAAAPQDEALLFEAGQRHAFRGDARAITELESVARSDGDNAHKRGAAALLALGKYYWLRGQKEPARALTTLDALTKRFPESAEARDQAPYNQALALHQLKRDAEARQLLDRWLADAPKDTSRVSAYAWLAYKNDFDRARGIEVAKRGLELDPKNDGLWDTLGELYGAVGKRKEAQAAAARALALKPDDTYYQAQLRKHGGGK